MISITLLALLLTPADVKVSMLDGQVRIGQLTAVSVSEVSLSENEVEAKLPIAEVMSIDFPATTSKLSEEPQVLTLIDGSQLYGSAVTRNAKKLTLESSGLGKLDIDSRVVQSVRLQADNPTYRSQWNTFLKRESEKDLLIVAKRDGLGLDFLAGVVTTISAEKTEFLLDGETVPVPAARVYGVIFAKSTPEVDAQMVAIRNTVRVASAQGDTIAAKSVTLQGDKLLIEAGWGQTLQASIEQIQKIDLSGGRVQFLSDVEPIEERFDGVDPEGSLLSGLIDKEQQTLLFGPRRDSTMERQAKLRLRGREFSKGICIHSRTEISWALDQRFSSLDCIVGIDDEVAFNGTHSVAVKIMGDSNILFDKMIATTDEPTPLRLTLNGVSTLSILVDFGDGESICDWLDLADARLVIAKDKQ